MGMFLNFGLSQRRLAYKASNLGKVALAFALAAFLAVPSAPAFAEAVDSTAQSLHVHGALNRDGESGSVVLCISQDNASEVARELGIAADDATSGETDVLAAESTTLQNYRGNVTWNVLMDVSADSLEDVDSTVAASAQDAQTLLLVSIESTDASTDALVEWASGCSRVISCEADSQYATAAMESQTEAAALTPDEADVNEEGDDDKGGEGGEGVSGLDTGIEPGADFDPEPDTQTIEPTTFNTPSLSDYSEYLWYLTNYGVVAEGEAGFDIDAAEALEAGIQPATKQQVVAVIDTGVDSENPAIKDNVITGLTDYAELASLPGIHDDYYSAMYYHQPYDPIVAVDHGTHVSGIVVETSKMGDADAEGVSILPIVAGDDSIGFSDSSLIRAYEFVVLAKKAGINVVAANASVGSDSYLPLAVRLAVSKMVDAGVSFAMSSSNEGVDIDDTAYSSSSLALPGTLIVGATGADGQVAVYSNYGQRNVDIMAPGSNILSTSIDSVDARKIFLGQVAYYDTLQDALNARVGATDSGTGTIEAANFDGEGGSGSKAGIEGASASDVEQASRPQVVYYEGFETSSVDDVVATADSMTDALAAEPDINGGLSFTYGSVYMNEDYEYVVESSGDPVEIVTDTHFMGKSAGVFNDSAATQAIVSSPLNSVDGEAVSAVGLQALDVALKASADMGAAEVYVGVIDETGTFQYGATRSIQAATLHGGLWGLVGDHNRQILPDEVLKDLASASPNHIYRMVVFATEAGVPVYVDSACVGYGMVGLHFETGTSMATPVVTGIMAVAAANWKDDTAAERAARVYGSAVYSESLNDKCS